MFGAGTACIVCPVERIVFEGKTLNLATMDKGLFIFISFYSIHNKYRSSINKSIS
jgi:hypothetical protein